MKTLIRIAYVSGLATIIVATCHDSATADDRSKPAKDVKWLVEVVTPPKTIRRAPAEKLSPLLVDANGRWVHYSVLTNKTQWRFIAGRDPARNSKPLYVNGCYDEWGGTTFSPVGPDGLTPAEAKMLPRLPRGSLEMKLAWRVLETCKLPDSPKPNCTAS